MLALLRGFLNTWPARLFFLLLAGAFALWGVANKNPFGGDSSAVATVGGHTIELPEIQSTYRRNLAQVSQMMGGKTDLSPDMKHEILGESVDQVVTEAALRARARSLGIVVPDAALRQAAFALPQFHNQAGFYDPAVMRAALRQNNLTEQGFLDLLRSEQTQRQLLGAVLAGAEPSDTTARQMFGVEHEKRVADVVELPFAAVPPPAAPTDAQLHRWYDNHPGSYASPEYRRVKAALLTPASVGRDIAVSDDDLAAAYAQHKADYIKPERRTVQVLTLQDEQTARRLDTQWSLGADWETMQKAAQAAGGTAIAFGPASRTDMPAPELAKAAFSVGPGTVALPTQGPLGWYVVRVVAAEAGSQQSLADARDALRARVVADKAADLIDQRANKIDDLLQGGAKLDDLPGDLGLVGVTGTMDAQGMTQAGTPAPIPASPALRQAMIQAAFQAHVGDPLKLTQAPADAPGAAASYFVVSVEAIVPPATRPYDTVAEQVRADWTRDAVRRVQDAAAAKLLAEVQGGQSLSDVAAHAGLTVRRLPATGRANPADGMPPSLIGPLFGLAKGGATMIETQDGFDVAVLASIDDPNPTADPIGFARTKETLDRAIARDTEAVFAKAVRDAAHPRINQAALAGLAQEGQ